MDNGDFKETKGGHSGTPFYGDAVVSITHTVDDDVHKRQATLHNNNA